MKRLHPMLYKRQISILFLLCCIVVAGTAAISATQKERNLQVLPKDISDSTLDSIMHSYNIALGVQCNFCHVPLKNFKDSLDYASDAEPMKENARDMIRMMIDINRRYFYYDSTQRPEYLNTVSCKTCHRGEPFPPED
ncbi:MAG: c-type cytochrome [Chitinophagaceae bacterium]|nr:c-type cytochrome [Chitinophagaceae bacterium]HQV05871.1 c-type cytochrome [Chitinophagaceae bacterium]